jgi:hypothetical protein
MLWQQVPLLVPLLGLVFHITSEDSLFFVVVRL